MQCRPFPLMVKDKVYQISFGIEDTDFALQIDDELVKMKKWNPNFYYKHFQTSREHLFQISTDDPDEESIRKLLFKLKLKLRTPPKVR